VDLEYKVKSPGLRAKIVEYWSQANHVLLHYSQGSLTTLCCVSYTGDYSLQQTGDTLAPKCNTLSKCANHITRVNEKQILSNILAIIQICNS